MEQFNSGTFRSGLVKFGQVKSGQVLMHLRMEFDSGVGPTCFIFVVTPPESNLGWALSAHLQIR